MVTACLDISQPQSYALCEKVGFFWSWIIGVKVIEIAEANFS